MSYSISHISDLIPPAASAPPRRHRMPAHRQSFAGIPRNHLVLCPAHRHGRRPSLHRRPLSPRRPQLCGGHPPRRRTGALPSANFLLVASPLQALQTLTEQHRLQFDIPMVGITGSNGKTIVKEWIYPTPFAVGNRDAQPAAPTTRKSASPFRCGCSTSTAAWRSSKRASVARAK